MDALCCCQRPSAFISLLCSRATPQTKNNSKNAEVIAMLSACNVSTIVVWLCSIEPIARNAARKDVDKPKELTSTNHAHKRMHRFGWDWGGDVGWMCTALTGSQTFVSCPHRPYHISHTKSRIQTNKLRPTGLGIQATSALVNGRFARSAR